MADDPPPQRTRTVTWDDPKAAARRSRKMSGSDFFEAMRRGTLPEAPFGRLLGIDLFDAGEGRFVMTLQPQEVHYNPMGCVHGGILATLLDSVMSAAVHTALPAGKSYLTREFTITFHRPVFDKTGEIMAEGQVVLIGEQEATAEGRIIASDQRVYATGRATCAIFDTSPAAAAGQPRQEILMAPKYTADHIRSEVKKLMADLGDLPPDQITDTARFVDDLGMDSLRAMELMVSVEKQYGIVIPEQEFAGIRNVNDAVAAVQRHLAA